MTKIDCPANQTQRLLEPASVWFAHNLPRATQALRNHDAIRPKMAELGERLARERVVAIPLRGKWREPLAGEAAHRVADQPLRLGE